MESKLRTLSKTLITATMLLGLSCASTDSNPGPGDGAAPGQPGAEGPAQDASGAREGSCTTNQTSQCCGDDVCDGPETSETCPEDCGEGENDAGTEDEGSTGEDDAENSED